MDKTQFLESIPRANLKRDALIDSVLQQVTQVFAQQRLSQPHVLVGLSGGLDSIVLLHVLMQVQAQQPFTISAAHVHHGLSTQADAWATFCQQVCAQYQIPFTLKKVTVDVQSGLGLEASARQARYQALQEVLAHTQAHFLCLAHHQNDQAETLLLQLARGAGVKGLSAMAQLSQSPPLFRPLLSFSRNDLEGYAHKAQLTWVNDESNANTEFDRNFMRHQVLPLLQARYPAIQQTLARTASHMAETSQLLDALAQIDLKALQHQHLISSLNVADLALLTPARAANALRGWFAQNQALMPSAGQLQQILQQLCNAKKEAHINIKVGEGLVLKRYQGWAYWVSEHPTPSAINMLWQGQEEVKLPDGTSLRFTQKLGEGLAFMRGGSAIKYRIKYREGGEQIKPAHNRPTRSLKVVLQQSTMLPWQRAHLPLVFMDEKLVVVPNIAIDAAMQAQPHELGVVIEWHC